MKYCKDAYKLLKIKVDCGKECPLCGNCPRMIMEDASDKAIEKAMKRMFEIIDNANRKG